MGWRAGDDEDGYGFWRSCDGVRLKERGERNSGREKKKGWEMKKVKGWS